jgi:hypothetical protein
MAGVYNDSADDSEVGTIIPTQAFLRDGLRIRRVQSEATPSRDSSAFTSVIDVPESTDDSLLASLKIREVRDGLFGALDSLRQDGMEAAEDRFSLACRDLLGLFVFREVCGNHFISLITLLDAAMRRKNISDFSADQVTALKDAWMSMSNRSLSAGDVSSHVREFAIRGIDILAPLSPVLGHEVTFSFARTENTPPAT